MRFLSITKPGIIFGNLVTAAGGYFLAAHAASHFNFPLFFFTLVGIALVIASGCVFNNYIDQDIDALMLRTQRRVLPQKLLSSRTAILYGIFLGLSGLVLLGLTTNLLTVSIAFTGLFIYVFVYSAWLKRTSHYGTLIGGIAGAVPPLVGYCAVTNQFDLGAVLLFLILFFWQMPHFYAIAIYRLTDFKAAHIPVLPLQKTVAYTKKIMLVYILIFTFVAALPALTGYAGFYYFSIALLLGIGWFLNGLWGFKKTQSTLEWSRRMFVCSIFVITCLCSVMILPN